MIWRGEKLISNKVKIVRLLNKSKKSLLRGIFSRTTVIAILLILQLLFLLASYSWLEQYRVWLATVEHILTIGAVLYLVNSEMDALSRVTWLILVMIAPLLGAMFLMYTKFDWGYRGLKQRLETLIDESQIYLEDDPETLNQLKSSTSTTSHLVQYFEKAHGNFPVYRNTDVTFLPTGEAFFEKMKEELLKAKKYIFLEFFIIDEGIMWGEILSILEQKVEEGVEVRILYDGMIEITKLSFDYTKRLEKIGIKAKAFSPISPFISTYYNYRDHRKIVVIDGVVGMTGGVNLADEYINHIELFGHWKDSGIMLKGKAVDSFLLLFLQMWSITEEKMLVAPYLGVHDDLVENEGYVIPYGDSPLDTDKVGENVYIDILNHAREYVYIMTPYLILDSELEHAIQFAAERGVDVRIIMPGIPDKPIPYALAKTYYQALIKSGVKIYEYTPGFVHSKIFLSDNTKAVVGTINLDYRSLYHHFECAVYLYKVDAIQDIYRDYMDTLNKSRLVSLKDINNIPKFQKVIGIVTKTIAPLL
ncbi:TPA: cardiolipin synthase [Streptococcus agalactiae]|nr:cardiolipin synthase [Streptococcus agalactiae]